MTDNVNHPSHYESVVNGIECIDVTENFNFNRGNAIKYIWRAGHKDKSKEIEDLQKAAWYIQREILRLKKEEQPREVPVDWQAN
jgi:hypothetical protein